MWPITPSVSTLVLSYCLGLRSTRRAREVIGLKRNCIQALVQSLIQSHFTHWPTYTIIRELLLRSAVSEHSHGFNAISLPAASAQAIGSWKSFHICVRVWSSFPLQAMQVPPPWLMQVPAEMKVRGNSCTPSWS